MSEERAVRLTRGEVSCSLFFTKFCIFQVMFKTGMLLNWLSVQVDLRVNVCMCVKYVAIILLLLR